MSFSCPVSIFFAAVCHLWLKPCSILKPLLSSTHCIKTKAVLSTIVRVEHLTLNPNALMVIVHYAEIHFGSSPRLAVIGVWDIIPTSIPSFRIFFSHFQCFLYTVGL
jgi:hypothetical protein